MVVKSAQSAMSGAVTRLNGKMKAAVLLVALAPDAASGVFRHLTEAEVETLTKVIATLPQVNQDTRDAVLREFHTMVQNSSKHRTAGPAYARALLERSLGVDKADIIMGKVEGQSKQRPFGFANRVEPAQLMEFIRSEHPQTIALILAHLKPNQASAILSGLPAERQVEVAHRLATLDRADPDLLRDIEEVLRHRLLLVDVSETQAIGGVDVAVEILNRVDSTTERAIMDGLEIDNPELAAEIKKRMLVFEDLVYLNEQSIQRVIREVEAKEWALALRTASEEVSNCIFSNMSKRLTELVQEEMEYLGLVRLREVEEVQQRIVGVIRELEEAGEVVVSRIDETEVFV